MSRRLSETTHFDRIAWRIAYRLDSHRRIAVTSDESLCSLWHMTTTPECIEWKLTGPPIVLHIHRWAVECGRMVSSTAKKQKYDFHCCFLFFFIYCRHTSIECASCVGNLKGISLRRNNAFNSCRQNN